MLLSINVSVASDCITTMSYSSLCIRVSICPSISSVTAFSIYSDEVRVISCVILTDLPSATAVFNVVSSVTSVNVSCVVPEFLSPSAVSAQAVHTRGFVTSPDVTKAAHMGSAHTNTRVIRMGSSRLFMAVPPSISQCSSPVPLCRRISHEEISDHPQALLYDHLTRKCRERQREYPDVGITNPRTNH